VAWHTGIAFLVIQVPSRKTDISDPGKRKIIFKIDFSGDTLVPSKVMVNGWFGAWWFGFLASSLGFLRTGRCPDSNPKQTIVIKSTNLLPLAPKSQLSWQTPILLR